MTVNHNDPKLIELNAALQRARDKTEGAIHDLHRAVGDRTGPRDGIITWLLNHNQAIGAALGQAVGPDARGRVRAERALAALANAELDQASAEADVNAYYAEVEPDYCRPVNPSTTS